MCSADQMIANAAPCGSLMIPLSTEYAIREAVRLLRLSRRNFKSHQIEQARELLEIILLDLPERPPKS